MINIQFMGDKNKSKNKLGHEIYIPDYDNMIKNACCKEEIECIENARESLNKINDGFVFRIVYTDYRETIQQDLKTLEIKWVKKWNLLQHPWYVVKGKYVTKEEMLRRIASDYMRM